MTQARYRNRKDTSAEQNGSALLLFVKHHLFSIVMCLFSSCFHMRIFTLFFAIGRNHINRRRFFVMFTKKKNLSNFCIF